MSAMRILSGILMLLTLAGCDNGGGGSGRSDIERTNNIPDQNDTGTGGSGGNTGTQPPVTATESNLYLPTTSGVIWHYQTDSSGEAITARFDGTTTIDGKTLGNFTYSMGLTDYVLSDPTYVGYGGSQFSLADPQSSDLYTFDVKLKTAHPFLGQNVGNTYSGDAVIGVNPGNIQVSAIPYNGSISAGSVSRIDAGDVGSVPARRVSIMLNPGGWVGDVGAGAVPEFLRPLLEQRTVQLWLAPGIGIVQRNDGGIVRRLTSIEGIQNPLVFEFAASAPVQPATQQILVDGVPVDHQEWPVEVLYRTSPTGWLKVEFDGTGSWRASLSSLKQGAGLHAATVRFKQETGDVDVPVILWVR